MASKLKPFNRRRWRARQSVVIGERLPQPTCSYSCTQVQHMILHLVPGSVHACINARILIWRCLHPRPPRPRAAGVPGCSDRRPRHHRARTICGFGAAFPFASTATAPLPPAALASAIFSIMPFARFEASATRLSAGP